MKLVAGDLAVKHSFPSVTRSHLLDPLQIVSRFPHLFSKAHWNLILMMSTLLQNKNKKNSTRDGTTLSYSSA